MNTLLDLGARVAYGVTTLSPNVAFFAEYHEEKAKVTESAISALVSGMQPMYCSSDAGMNARCQEYEVKVVKR